MEKYKIDSQVIARTIILAIALINQIFAIFGRQQIPVQEDTVYQIVSLLFTIVTTVWSWWKNNSFTPEAIKADEYMHKLKAQRSEND
jgi:SPP1 family holin